MFFRGLASLNEFPINLIEVGVHHTNSPIFLLCLPGRGGMVQYIRDDCDRYEIEPEEGKDTAMIQIFIDDELARPLTCSYYT